MKIYLAGGLFNAGERLHNLCLEKYLSLLGHEVVLPQREALNFLNNGHLDLKGLGADCKTKCTDQENIYVGSVDGADADSGTAIEYGMAIIVTGRAIIYRTDCRTELEKELGVNAMFSMEGTKFIHEECSFTELNQVEDYYKRLASAIDEVLKEMK